MREKDLQFDRKKHVICSNRAKKGIRAKLIADYGAERGEELWEKTHLKFVKFLKDMPYVGGKKSPHGGTYDSILVFAYYTVVPEKPSLDELQKMNKVLDTRHNRLCPIRHRRLAAGLCRSCGGCGGVFGH